MLKRTLTASIAVMALAAFGLPAMADAPGEAGLDTGSVSAAAAGAPVYPGGKPINGGLLKITQYSKVTGTNVTFSTPDSFDKVHDFYKHALPKNSETTEPQAGSKSRIAVFQYTKGDGSKIDIEINEYPGHTNYTVNDTYKK